MSEFPDGWFRGTPGADRKPGDPSSEPTTDLPARPPSRSASPPSYGAPPRNARAAAPRPAAPRGGAGGAAQAGSAWPDQPPPRSGGQYGAPARSGRAGSPGAPVRPGQPGPGGPGRPGGPGGPGGPRPPYGPGSLRPRGARAWLRPRRILAVIAGVIALLLVAVIAVYFTINGKLDRRNVLVSYAAQPAQGAGTNWLIAGSDSRQGLTRAQERRLSTGVDAGGHRSDTILILHMGAGGKPILISLPRDSWVNIPGHGASKINAAYSLGGARLLATTVQNATGLRIDHYMEIGFGGFVNVINAVGGVRMCLKFPLHDQASGLNLRPGCHVLHGKQALAFVRDRHTFAQQDLQRIQDQRLLLRALLTKLTSAGTLLNPFKSIPAANGVAGTLTVDKGTSLLQLAEVAFALRSPVTTTVPIATAAYAAPDGESAVLWDRSQALTLFNDLNAGRPVPRRLITGSKLAG